MRSNMHKISERYLKENFMILFFKWVCKQQLLVRSRLLKTKFIALAGLWCPRLPCVVAIHHTHSLWQWTLAPHSVLLQGCVLYGAIINRCVCWNCISLQWRKLNSYKLWLCLNNYWFSWYTVLHSIVNFIVRHCRWSMTCMQTRTGYSSSILITCCLSLLLFRN